MAKLEAIEMIDLEPLNAIDKFNQFLRKFEELGIKSGLVEVMGIMGKAVSKTRGKRTKLLTKIEAILQ